MSEEHGEDAGVEFVTPSRDALAEVLCPPSHREGFAGSITGADGVVRAFASERRPCLVHASQAGALLASGVVRLAPAVDVALANAWDEGHRHICDLVDDLCVLAGHLKDNPYREESK